MKMFILALAALPFAVLPLASQAAPYENAAGYALDLPPGWSSPSKPDAAPALFVHQGESITVKLTVVPKPAPMGAPEQERLKAQDEATLKKTIQAYKSVPVQGPLIANAPATHYGFLYKDATGAVMLSRFALFSRARATDHQWAKLNAVIPKSRLNTAVPQLEKLLAAFRWKAAGDTSALLTPPSPSAVAPTTTPAVVTMTDTPPPPPPGKGGSAGGRIKFKKMSDADARALSANVTEGLTARTEEEKAIARQRTFGDTFQDKGDK